MIRNCLPCVPVECWGTPGLTWLEGAQGTETNRKKKSQSQCVQWRKSQTCQAPLVPPGTAPRSPVSVTDTRHSLPHLCGGRKPPGFTTQCPLYMPARAASLEKQIVPNPATLLSVNDPKAEGSSGILLTLQRFSQLTARQTQEQREYPWLRAHKHC